MPGATLRRARALSLAVGTGQRRSLTLHGGLVRGYDSNSFETGECGNSTDGSCPAFDRLIGSQVAIGNAELRFPLWGAFHRDQFYGPLPVEVAFFSDIGIAIISAPFSMSDWKRSGKRKS